MIAGSITAREGCLGFVLRLLTAPVRVDAEVVTHIERLVGMRLGVGPDEMSVMRHEPK